MSHEHHGAHADPHDPFQRKVAISMSVYAVLLAFTTMLTNQARTEALLLSNQSANQWAYFQAKSTKGVVVTAEAELVAAIAPDALAPAAANEHETASAADDEKAHEGAAKKEAIPAHAAHESTDGTPIEPGAATDAAKPSDVVAAPVKLHDRLRAEAGRYEHEKAEIQEKAREYTADGEREKVKEHWFEYAATMVEVAIVIATVGLLLNSRKAFYTSIALSGASVILTVITALR